MCISKKHVTEDGTIKKDELGRGIPFHPPARGTAVGPVHGGIPERVTSGELERYYD